ncbi:MAG: hypothetical protein HKN23_16490 [Verrucomicrobiales bacterium]|nr:hypothetical protein [Verrucomicrobiales bacterium]
MRILFTNNTLDHPAGTELSLRDAAVRMSERDHDVIGYSRQQGEVADSLRQLGIPVVSELSEIPVGWEPDLIHGHHEWETSMAALKYPNSPILSFCRGVHAWQEAPCTAPNVVRYAVVDLGCRDRLIRNFHIPDTEIDLVLNGINLGQFPEREKYAKKVKRVLVFSNYAKEDNYLAVIREACEAESVECEAIGAGVRRTISDPSDYLLDADLVFAKGKAALEACATGCTVVVCDEPGLAPNLVRPDNFQKYRELSFGYPIMTEPHDVEAYRARINGHHPGRAEEVCQLARETGSIEATIDRLEEVYARTLHNWDHGLRELVDLESFATWAAAYFEKKTTACKLGRECQEIWRAMENESDPGRHARPISSADETIESHRIMDTLRKAPKLKEELKAQKKEIRKRDKEGDKKGSRGLFRR